jgi:tetratricopeptide (TPR) repeat protein
MNKKYFYLGLLYFFVLASAFVVISYKHKSQSKTNAFYPLQERKGISALTPEWKSTKEKASNLIRIVRENPDNSKSALALASLYIKEARITGNSMYYDAAAMKYVNQVLEREPDNFEALTLKALIYLSEHHFADALIIAQQAQKIGPYNAFVYGLMVDSYVEMGDYKAAIEAADKMISLRPDISSYSRVSYLREIHGDIDGAIEAMKMAVKAGSYGDESTSWARMQLARLYESIGDLKSAEMHYIVAGDQRPGYAYSSAGLGHIAMARKEYKKAISLYLQADSSMMDYSFKEQLAQLYKITGDTKKAQQITNEIIENMSKDAGKGEEDENIGHYADREMAYTYLLVDDYEKALQHALAEYNRRPNNIDVNETVAWVYYKKGEYQKALPYIDTALKTNCKNPVLLFHAGMIYAKIKQQDKAKSLLREALKNNPNVDIPLRAESLAVLQTL